MEEGTFPLSARTSYIDIAAPSLDDFMYNWKALYNAIAAPGTFPLYPRERGATSEVFYRDCTACTAVFGTVYAAKMQIKVNLPHRGVVGDRRCLFYLCRRINKQPTMNPQQPNNTNT